MLGDEVDIRMGWQRVEERGRHKKTRRMPCGGSVPRQRRGVRKGKRKTARKKITLRG